LSFGIVSGQIHEHANAPHRLPLLRTRRNRPRRRTADQRDERTPGASSLDHLVGAGEERRWEAETW
jgi:hypothetical protein